MTALAIHIIAGVLGLGFGYVALFASKGAPLHRRSGTAFVFAMVIMGVMGATMAAVWRVAPEGNVPAGVLAAYLTLTGFTTVRPVGARWRWVDPALMLVALAVGLAELAFGAEALASPNGRLHGVPAAPFLVFAVLGLLASLGDFRLIRAGGALAIRGVPRITRHLWRMSLALTLAAFSFFLGQAKLLPKAMRILPLLSIPVLVVLVTMLYWLWRVRLRRTLRGMPRGLVAHSA